MARPYEHLRGLLEAELSAEFAILPPSLSPVIPRGTHGVMPYRTGIRPLAGQVGNGSVRDNTFTVAVISPLSDMGSAQAELNDSVDAVLDALETDDAIIWSGADFGAFNDVLWCYTITLTIASTHTPADEPAETGDP
jgi:hypothetical protein